MKPFTKKLVKDIARETKTSPYHILNLKFDHVHFQDRLLMIPIRHSAGGFSREVLLDVTISKAMKDRLLNYVREEGLGPGDFLFPITWRNRSSLALELQGIKTAGSGSISQKDNDWAIPRS